MLHNITVGLLVAAFVGTGMFNAIGTPAAQDNFARWAIRVGGAASLGVLRSWLQRSSRFPLPEAPGSRLVS